MVLAADVISAATLLVILLCRPNGVFRTGQLLVLLGAGALPWSAVEVHGVPVGDLPLLLGAGILVFSAKHLWVPAPVLFGSGLIGIAGLLTQAFPTSLEYLGNRAGATSTSLVTVRTGGDFSSLGKYEVAILLLPAIVCIASQQDRRFPSRLIVAWVIGISLSTLVALFDRIGLTHVSMSLLGSVASSGRQSGLTAQPNNVGVQAAMAVPLIMLGFLSNRRRTRLFGVLGLAACGTGVYLSGSRGAAAVLVVAAVATLAFVPTMRRWLPRAALLLALGIGYLAFSGVGETVLKAVRLAGQASMANGAAQSDQGRKQLAEQGLRDFAHSPVFGIGYGHLDEAHVIYIQLLAAGGALAAVGFFLMVFGVSRRAVRRLPDDVLVRALVASVATWLAVGLVENQLADQWIYVPLAAAAGLLCWERHQAETAPTVSESEEPVDLATAATVPSLR